MVVTTRMGILGGTSEVAMAPQAMALLQATTEIRDMEDHKVMVRVMEPLGSLVVQDLGVVLKVMECPPLSPEAQGSEVVVRVMGGHKVVKVMECPPARVQDTEVVKVMERLRAHLEVRHSGGVVRVMEPLGSLEVVVKVMECLPALEVQDLGVVRVMEHHKEIKVMAVHPKDQRRVGVDLPVFNTGVHHWVAVVVQDIRPHLPLVALGMEGSHERDDQHGLNCILSHSSSSHLASSTNLFAEIKCSSS